MRALMTIALVVLASSATRSETAPAADAVAAVIVFGEDGVRRAGVVVEVGAARAVTDDAGRAELALAPGTWMVTLRAGDTPAVSTAPALFAPGGVVDVVVTLADDGTLVTVDVASVDPADGPAPGGLEDSTSTDTRTVVLVATDALSGKPVGGARCFLRGGGFVGTTGDDGALTAALPRGAAAVSFVHPRYSARVVEIEPAQDSDPAQGPVRVELLPAATDMEELTVRAPHIDGGLSSSVEEKRAEKQVVEVIGAEQMKRSGDGDAAAALRRATGLTVVGGRYVYVRGLGDRYSSTLLDGAQLPSPEPERRVVPLDMFPAGMLSGVVVQKTWSPDLPGEFGGGTVQLRTRRLPERPFLDLSVGGAGMLGSTFGEALMGPGGGLDFLGIDDGRRALPAELQAASADQPLAEKNSLTPGGYSPQELERFGESLSRAYTPRAGTLMPSTSLSTSFGLPFSLPFADAGVLGSLGWGQDWQAYTIERHQFTVGSGGKLQSVEDGVVRATDRTVSLGGLLSFGLELTGPLAGHSLQSTTFVNRGSDDEVRVLEGYEREVNTDFRATRLRWVERSLVSQRLGGEHPLPFLSSTLSWRYGYALALRDEPDQRETRVDQDPTSGEWLLSDRPEGNQRLFSNLVDHGHDAGLTWRMPLPSFTDVEGALQTGVGLVAKTREVDTRRYKFVVKGPAAGDATLRARPVDEIFTPENIGPGGFQLAEATRKTDNYSGAMWTGSTFAMADVPLPFGLTLSGGARLEVFHMDVTTFELFNAAATPTVAALDTVDVLPSLSLVWAVTDDMQLRLAAASTVTRPEMRELSPAVFTDVTGGRSRYGNPELSPGSIAHVDARWEWYLSPTDSLSLATFGKRFTSPIETVVTSGADQSITYENADSALNLGVELEARVGLGHLHDVLADFSVGGNGALVWSSVTLPEDGIQTSRERPLEGQSPWVANLQLGWDRAEWGTSASLLYNVFGPRIREVGVLGAPDVYEQPFHQLDVVLAQQLPWGLTLNVRGQNLLAPAAVLVQGGEVIEKIQRGPVFSASLGLKL